jgi:hypothetical protein
MRVPLPPRIVFAPACAGEWMCEVCRAEDEEAQQASTKSKSRHLKQRKGPRGPVSKPARKAGRRYM